jgi:hypothetical protein
MGDKRELILSVLLLIGGFIIAPHVIDRIPLLSTQGPVIKVILHFVFAMVVFFFVVLLWAFLIRSFRK